MLDGGVTLIIENLSERSEDNPSNEREIIDKMIRFYFVLLLPDDRTNTLG